MKCSSPPEWKRFRPLGMGIHSKPTLCAERKRKKARSSQRMGHPRHGEGQKRKSRKPGVPGAHGMVRDRNEEPKAWGTRPSFRGVLITNPHGMVRDSNRRKRGVAALTRFGTTPHIQKLSRLQR